MYYQVLVEIRDALSVIGGASLAIATASAVALVGFLVWLIRKDDLDDN